MRSKGRPPTRPASLMDGFYIEVRNIGSKDKAVRVRGESVKAMEISAAEYARNKEVTILGEHNNNKWLSEPIKVPLRKKIEYAD